MACAFKRSSACTLIKPLKKIVFVRLSLARYMESVSGVFIHNCTGVLAMTLLLLGQGNNSFCYNEQYMYIDSGLESR